MSDKKTTAHGWRPKYVDALFAEPPFRPHVVFTGHRKPAADGTSVACGVNLVRCWFGSFVGLHGDAIGTDQVVDRELRNLGMDVLLFPPDYQRWGRGAPWKRNIAMLEREHVVFVVAFWDGRTNGGTWQTINEARKRGLPVLMMPISISRQPDR